LKKQRRAGFITADYEEAKYEVQKYIFGREIRLSREVWDHILKTHPELKGKLDRVKETLINPEIIRRSVYASNVLLFYKFYEKRYGECIYV
jgi:hypothetical protein